MLAENQYDRMRNLNDLDLLIVMDRTNSWSEQIKEHTLGWSGVLESIPTILTNSVLDARRSMAADVIRAKCQRELGPGRGLSDRLVAQNKVCKELVTQPNQVTSGRAFKYSMPSFAYWQITTHLVMESLIIIEFTKRKILRIYYSNFCKVLIIKSSIN